MIDNFTSQDYEKFFIKLAHDINAKSYNDLEQHIKIKTNSHEKIAKYFNNFTKKLALDKNLLKETFNV